MNPPSLPAPGSLGAVSLSAVRFVPPPPAPSPPALLPQAGVALFPDSAFVAMVYANFMLEMLGFSQTGARQLEVVKAGGG